jgi:TonB family protein
MNFDYFYKRFVAFGLAFALSLFAAGFLYGINYSNIFKKESKPAPKIVVSAVTNGDGASGGAAHAPCYTDKGARCFPEKSEKVKPVGPTKGVKIISKPRASYTDAARANSVQGKVVLRVTFGANGQIGAISVVSGLPDGLIEAAKEAAKGIKFEPATRGNVPYSVTKPVEYTFTIY